MMDTSYSSGFDSGLALLWAFHMLGMLAVSIGILFLIFLAYKKLTEKQLKFWGLTLLGVGLVICALTLVSLPVQRIQTGTMMQQSGNPEQGHMMMEGMGHMMDDDEMNMMNDSDHMSMSMNDMSGMLKGKTGDAFDAAFIEGMIPHHQGAIDMAIAARASAGHDEIKRMAEDIISAQQREIDMMKQWQKNWAYTE